MTTVRLSGFQGEAPRISAELLPDRVAQYAMNCKLYSGDLMPFPNPVGAETLTRSGTISSMFPLRGAGDSREWLHWTDDVDVATSLLADDSSQRVYYSGDGAPKQTNFALATTGTGDYPIASRPLGLPTPTAAPTATVSSNAAVVTVSRARANNIATLVLATAPNFGKGTSIKITGLGGTGYNLTNVTVTELSGSTISYNSPGTDEGTTADAAGSVAFGGSALLRNYVYTWYTDWAEESPPSPASTDISAYNGQAATIATLPTTAPTGYSGVVTHKRVYRSVSSPSGAYYAYVGEVDLATATLVDSATDNTLGAVLGTEDYDIPDASMVGLTNMANGIIAGFFGNQVCFCEPYKPWAWPIKYRKTMSDDVVGIAAINTSLVVLTKKSPTLVTGTHPQVMSANRVDVNFPCVAKRSIVNMGTGIAYACPDGIVFVATQGHSLITKKVHYRDTWRDLVSPETIVAEYYNGKYFASHATGGFIFEQEENPLGGTYTQVNFRITAAHYDFLDGYLYYVADTSSRVLRWDDPDGTSGSFDWKSKAFRFAEPLNFGAARIFADYVGAPSGAVTADELVYNATITDSLSAVGDTDISEFEVGGSAWFEAGAAATTPGVTFQVYAGGELKFTKQVYSNAVFRLPMGFLADQWEFRVASSLRVREVHIGETPSELRKV